MTRPRVHRTASEHVPPHDVGTEVLEPFAQHVITHAGLAAGFAVHLAEDLQLDGPVVQLLAAFAEAVLAALVRPGRITSSLVISLWAIWSISDSSWAVISESATFGM